MCLGFLQVPEALLVVVRSLVVPVIGRPGTDEGDEEENELLEKLVAGLMAESDAPNDTETGEVPPEPEEEA